MQEKAENQEKLVIGLTGLPRSGKDTAADYLKKAHGFTKFDFYADVLVPELKKKKIKASKENATKFGQELRKKKGQGVLAEKLLKKIKRAKKEKIVITGFRSPKEVKVIQSEYPNFYLVEIVAPRKKRFERRINPKQSERSFLWRETNEIKKMGLKSVLKAAKLKVKNIGTISELHSNLDWLLETLI